MSLQSMPNMVNPCHVFCHQHSNAKNMFGLFVLTLSLLFNFGFGRQSYEGYKVIVVDPSTQSDLRVVEALSENADLEIDMWSLPRYVDQQATFMVPEEHADEALHILSQNNIKATVKINNLARLLDEEESQLRSRRKIKRTAEPDDYLNRYLSHEEMNTFLREVSSTCDACMVKSIGRSYEQREMLMIRIGSGHTVGKPGIWLDAGIHAREWIAPATAINVIHQLVAHFNARQGDNEDDVITSFVWYILPSANPDGYEYSRTEQRLWRKTRQPNAGSSCVGTDPNRNFGFHFGGLGTSPNPCSQIYPGRAAFSEPETQNMRVEMLALRTQLQSYISLHAYGQYWLCPWGYEVVYPDDYPQLLSLGQAAAAAIHNTTGKRYAVGSSAGLLYPAAGGSDDWAKAEAGIAYSYTVELRDSGDHGFLLPESEIPDTGREFWAAIQAAARWMLEEGEVATGRRS